MNIAWNEFFIVTVASLVAACLIVTIFSLALRIGGGKTVVRRPVSIALFVVCGLAVLFGIYLIVPALHR